MSNKFQYAEILRTTHVEILPEADVKGRGLVNYGGRLLEFQTALALEAEDSYERMEKIKGICGQMSNLWIGKTAKPIPVIPENPVWSEFVAMDEVKGMLADDRHLPIGYDLRNAQPYSMDLSRSYCYIISGKAHTGKTNLLRLLMMASKEKGGKLCVIDSVFGELEQVSKTLEAEYITTEREYFDFFSALVEPFKKRNVLKRDLVAAGMEEAEIYEKMQTEEKYYIFINDLPSFIQKVYKPEDGSVNIRGFLENITDKGRLHQVFFFACLNPDDWGKVTGITVFDNMVRYKTGIHLGGNVAAQRIFNFDYLPYMEQNKTVKTGIGLLPAGEEENQVERVVLPLARG